MENTLNSLLPNDLKEAFDQKEKNNQELQAYRGFFSKLGKNFDEMNTDEMVSILKASSPRQDIGAQPVEHGWREDTAEIAKKAYEANTSKESVKANKVDELNSKLLRQFANELGLTNETRADAGVFNRIHGK